MNIFDLVELNNKQRELQAETDSKMEAKYFNSYNIIDELYDIYYNGESKLSDVKEGIRSFTIEVMPNNKIHMPLDAIFKNINCTAEFPFIKYNPGKRRESICRLYSTGISKTGKKIPYLPKIKIISLNSITTANKQISIYNSIHKILITIESDGVIKIIGKFKNGVKTTSLFTFCGPASPKISRARASGSSPTTTKKAILSQRPNSFMAATKTPHLSTASRKWHNGKTPHKPSPSLSSKTPLYEKN